MFTEIKTIPQSHLRKQDIRCGYIIHSKNSYKSFDIYDAETLQIIDILEFKKKAATNYIIDCSKNVIYFTVCSNQMYSYSLLTKKMSLFFQSKYFPEKGVLSFVDGDPTSQKLYDGYAVLDNDYKIIESEGYAIDLLTKQIIYTSKKTNQKIGSWKYGFYHTENNSAITRLNESDDSKIWVFRFNDHLWGGRRYTQLVDDILVISLSFNDEFDRPDHNHLIGLDINTGELKWKLDSKHIFSWYQFDYKNKKLFTVDGFDNVIYQAIDPLTGTIEVEKNLSESHRNIEVNCQNVFLAEDNYLYFSSNTRAPIGDSEFDYDYLQPQVGAINTSNHELEYLVDIPIDMDTISRPSNALNTPPIVHKNRMYIMDNEDHLHILEK